MRALLVPPAALIVVSGFQPFQDPATDPLIVSAAFPADQWLAADASLTLRLSRRLTPLDGTLAVVVGTTDVTALLELRDTVVTYRPRGLRHAAGESQVAVYLVRNARWQQVAAVPIRVLTRSGLTAASLDPGFTLGSKGQLAEGGSGASSPGRGAYQDFTLNSGLQTSHAGPGWALRNQFNLVGASRREEALRFAALQADAPRIDLADYLVEYRRGESAVSLGHVSFGANRHVVNGFASRGVAARATRGPVTIGAAAMNGSSIVGWDNPIGPRDNDHLLAAASLGLEVLPWRPGAMRVDVTMLDGAVLPQTSFTQGAVVDAERSSGGGVHVATTVSPRLRAAAGFARSRFINPARDPQLIGDGGAVVRRGDSRNARYGELDLGILQNARILVPVTLTAALRHEQVDPLYRSVGAWAQADRLTNGVTLNGTVGAVALQATVDRSRDNLDDVPSVLTTRTRTSQTQLALPLATLVRASSSVFWPTVTVGLSSTMQEGKEIPADGEFSAGHVPDQQTTTRNGSASWQTGRWQLQYNLSHTHQDNRQAGREQADFDAFTSALTLGFVASARVSVNLDAGRDRQSNREFDQHNRTTRIGLTSSWRPWETTSVVANLSFVRTQDEPRTAAADQAQGMLEISRSISLGPSVNGQARTSAQLSLRLARQSLDNRVFLPDPSPPTALATWTLSSGLTMRLF